MSIRNANKEYLSSLDITFGGTTADQLVAKRAENRKTARNAMNISETATLLILGLIWLTMQVAVITGLGIGFKNVFTHITDNSIMYGTIGATAILALIISSICLLYFRSKAKQFRDPESAGSTTSASTGGTSRPLAKAATTSDPNASTRPASSAGSSAASSTGGASNASANAATDTPTQNSNPSSSASSTEYSAASNGEASPSPAKAEAIVDSSHSASSIGSREVPAVTSSALSSTKPRTVPEREANLAWAIQRQRDLGNPIPDVLLTPHEKNLAWAIQRQRDLGNTIPKVLLPKNVVPSTTSSTLSSSTSSHSSSSASTPTPSSSIAPQDNSGLPPNLNASAYVFSPYTIEKFFSAAPSHLTPDSSARSTLPATSMPAASAPSSSSSAPAQPSTHRAITSKGNSNAASAVFTSPSLFMPPDVNAFTAFAFSSSPPRIENEKSSIISSTSSLSSSSSSAPLSKSTPASSSPMAPSTPSVTSMPTVSTPTPTSPPTSSTASTVSSSATAHAQLSTNSVSPSTSSTTNAFLTSLNLFAPIQIGSLFEWLQRFKRD